MGALSQEQQFQLAKLTIKAAAVILVAGILGFWYFSTPTISNDKTIADNDRAMVAALNARGIAATPKPVADIKPVTPANPMPVLGWVKEGDQSYALMAAGWRNILSITPGTQSIRQRFVIEANHPVTAGLVSQDIATTIQSGPNARAVLAASQRTAALVNQTAREHGTDYGSAGECGQSSFLQAEFVCDYHAGENPWVLVVIDDRTPGDQIVAGIASVLTRSDRTNAEFEDNRIRVQAFSWGCIENCEK